MKANIVVLSFATLVFLFISSVSSTKVNDQKVSFIKAVCKDTTNPQACYLSLLPYETSIKADDYYHVSLITLTSSFAQMQKGAAYIRKDIKHIKSFGAGNYEQQVLEALQLCADEYNRTGDAIDGALFHLRHFYERITSPTTMKDRLDTIDYTLMRILARQEGLDYCNLVWNGIPDNVGSVRILKQKVLMRNWRLAQFVGNAKDLAGKFGTKLAKSS